jgi:hypothetical protein
MISRPLATQFQHSTYLIRRKVFKLFGAAFHIYDPSGQVVFYSAQKAFKLRDDIRLYSDESQSQELLTIHARSWVDFRGTFDVADSTTGEKVGALRRRGFTSLFRDEWAILDTADNEIGVVREDSAVMAMIRRFVPYGDFVPQKFVGTLNGQVVCEFRQNFNPFVQKITLDFTPDTAGLLDRRLGLAAAILLCAVEQRQHGE